MVHLGVFFDLVYRLFFGQYFSNNGSSEKLGKYYISFSVYFYYIHMCLKVLEE